MVLRLVISSSTEAGTFRASSISLVPAASRLFRDEPISLTGVEEDVEAVADFSKVIEVEQYDTPEYVAAGGEHGGQAGAAVDAVGGIGAKGRQAE